MILNRRFTRVWHVLTAILMLSTEGVRMCSISMHPRAMDDTAARVRNTYGTLSRTSNIGGEPGSFPHRIDESYHTIDVHLVLIWCR